MFVPPSVKVCPDTAVLTDSAEILAAEMLVGRGYGVTVTGPTTT